MFKSLTAFQISLLSVLLLVPRINLTAQNYEQKNFVRKKIQEIISEKLRLPADTIQSIQKINPNTPLKRLFDEESFGETQVANTSSPESEVHAAINPTDSNNMVLSPIQYNSGGGFTLPVYYTRNFGVNWQRSSFNAAPSQGNAVVVGGGDPVLAYDANGKLYMSWISLYYLGAISTLPHYWAMYWAYSNDGGKTWLRASDDKIGLGTGNIMTLEFNDVYDKQWMATDLSSSSYRNSLYVAYMKANTSASTIQIMFRRKKPGQSTFEPGEIPITDNSFSMVQFTNLVVDNSGKVHIIFYGTTDDNTYNLYHSVSINGGATFSTPAIISPLKQLSNIAGVKKARLYPCPQIATDTTNGENKGNLYVTWTTTGIDSAEPNGADIYFSRSTDGGNNWSKPVVVNDDARNVAKDQFYSSINVNSKGIITLTWYDGRYSGSNTTNDDVRYFITHSFDGGQTFVKNYQVSSVPTKFTTVGNKNNLFGIGEYNQVISSSGYAIPIWSDGRKNNGDLDIYFALISFDSSQREVKPITDDFEWNNLFPNPAYLWFNVSYSLKKPSRVQFTLYNVKGEIVRTFDQGNVQKGPHTTVLNINYHDNHIPSGSYILLFETDFGHMIKTVSIIGQKNN